LKDERIFSTNAPQLMMIGKIMSIMQIIKIVFRQLLKPLAGWRKLSQASGDAGFRCFRNL
jgi:hypothetical protein